MLIIRLQRTGRRNAPAYRLVVCEKSAPIQGKFIEVLGHYLPTRDPAELVYKADNIQEWVKKGAQPTDTVARLLKADGMKDMDKFIKLYAKKRPTKEPEPEPEAPAPAAEAPADEAPAASEEAPVEAAPEEEAAAAEEVKGEAPAEEASEAPAAEEKPTEDASAEEEASDNKESDEDSDNDKKEE